jgi:mannobiose 2-epimerase
MYKLTRDPLYLDVFEKTWNFIDKHQIDRKTGEWWETVDPDLRPSGNKAHAWKAGYHNGRAMIEAVSIIESLGVTK